jgi:hypothetical protein
MFDIFNPTGRGRSENRHGRRQRDEFKPELMTSQDSPTRTVNQSEISIGFP